MSRVPTRRQLLRTALAGTAAGLAGCLDVLNRADDEDGDGTLVSEDREGDLDVPDAVGLETVVDGLEMPLDVAFLPGGEVRYVATRPGLVLAYDGDELLADPLLDLRDRVVVGGERGLLGIELHPEFADNGRLFVRYSTEPRDGTPDGYSHTFVLSEFVVGDDRTRADAETERTILEVPQPQNTHNAGDVAFGPDGYLYVPTGDGGGAGDRGEHRPQDWYGENEGGNGQDTTESLLGGILRIDVDRDTRGSYATPPDNPLVDLEGHYDEYYAWGLRNPWRLSFDGTDLYVGDVGQAKWECVNLVEKGGNYGWNVREGSHCFDANSRYEPPDDCPDGTPSHVRGGEPLVDPVFEYPNERNLVLDTDEYLSGIAVVGGYVYRGTTIPELDGAYVFGDLSLQGRLFVGRPADGKPWPMDSLDLTAEDDDLPGELLGFGRDEDGELYVIGDGGVYRIVRR